MGALFAKIQADFNAIIESGAFTGIEKDGVRVVGAENGAIVGAARGAFVGAERGAIVGAEQGAVRGIERGGVVGVGQTRGIVGIEAGGVVNHIDTGGVLLFGSISVVAFCFLIMVGKLTGTIAFISLLLAVLVYSKITTLENRIVAVSAAAAAAASSRPVDENNVISSRDAIIASVSDSLCPVGTIVAYVGFIAPDGWILCEGQLIDFETPLASVLIAAGYQVLNGRSVKLPDLRGQYLVGKTKERSIGNMFGSRETKISIDQLPSHSHEASCSSAGAHRHRHNHVKFWHRSFHGCNDPEHTAYRDRSSTPEDTTQEAGAHNHAIVVYPTGSGKPLLIDPPSVVVNYIIKC